MKFLWLSNAAWAPSGYGEQAGLFLPRFQQLGHEVAQVANYGLQATSMDWHGIRMYPGDGQWGNTSIGTYAEHFGTDLVICLHDAWVMKPDAWPDGLRMAIWAPIDHYPIPPAVLGVLKHPKVTPIAMSRFGEFWMDKFGLDPLYVPHGIDTSIFKPQPEMREHVREALDIPKDAFLVGMVAANKGSPQFPRKGFPQAFEAFSRFVQDRDDVWLYVHTTPLPAGGGIDLEKLVLALDALSANPGKLKGRVRFPPPSSFHLGMPKEGVAALYQAFDVLLNPAYGEGFGIPVIEAQACGVPVIASNHSAMSELTQAGWLVDGDPLWDALQESFAFIPSIGSIERALEAAYASRDNAVLRTAAATFALEYDADYVTEMYWEPALAALERPREVKPLAAANGGGNRAQRRAAQKGKARA